ncbi:M48 family metallopeptidase [candidate division KSB1 bacterium]|nr:M48 family metallopeptidase [candidate division KSB1 bacterium]
MDKTIIEFGSKIIEFSVVHQERKSLTIFVLPDKRVLVKAPLTATNEQIKAKVKKRAAWILKQQRFFLSFEPTLPAKHYVSGETFLYLGKTYRLKIIKESTKKVRLVGQFLNVHVNDRQDHERVKGLVESWYLDHARRKLLLYCEPYLARFGKYGLRPSFITIQKMPKRWGSCSARGRILLNSELIKAPKGCIEYVIIHELCHLKYPRHNQDFVNLLTREMPDWEIWKERLERFLG